MTQVPDLGRLGWPGVAGFALLLAGLSYGAGSVLPTRDEVLRLQAQQAQLVAHAASLPTARASLPVVKLPPLVDSPGILDRIAALGESHRFPLDQATYRFVRGDGSARYEVALSVRTAYPALRGFVEEAFGLLPTATLDELVLRRTSATEPTVDATLRLSFHFAAE